MLDNASSDRTRPRSHALAARAADDTLPLLAIAAVMVFATSVWTSTTLTALVPLVFR